VTDVLITTVFLAAVYSLVALGLSLTWAGLGFLNLAHGVTYSAAAVGAYEASIHIGGNAFVVLIGGIVSGALIGFVIFLVVFLPLDGRRNFDLRTLIATLALALLGENLLLDKFGPQPQTFPEIFSWLPTINIGGTNVTSDQEGAVLAAVVLVAAFVAFLDGSRIGLGVRALTQNVEGARLVGIDRRNGGNLRGGSPSALRTIRHRSVANIRATPPTDGRSAPGMKCERTPQKSTPALTDRPRRGAENGKGRASAAGADARPWGAAGVRSPAGQCPFRYRCAARVARGGTSDPRTGARSSWPA